MKKLIINTVLLMFSVTAIAQSQNNNQPYNTNPTNAPTMQHQTPGTNQPPDTISKKKYQNNKKTTNKSTKSKSQNTSHTNQMNKNVHNSTGTNPNKNVHDTIK